MYELDGDFTSGMDHLSVFYEMEDNCDMGFKESSVGYIVVTFEVKII